MTRQPLDCREWLEDMLRFNSRDAERARELIDLLDEQDALLDEQDALLDEQDALLDEKGEQIDGIIEDFGELEDIRRDLEDYRNIRESCEAAEIIDEDADDEPLDPLLRMFLPI